MIRAEYFFIIPVVIAFMLLITYIILCNRKYEVKSRRKRILKLLYKGLDVFIPERSSRIYGFYSQLIRFTKLTVEQILKLKVLLFIFVIFICILIKLTNISIYTKEILNKFDFQCDLIYQNKLTISENIAMKQEIYFFRVVLKNISKSDISKYGKDGLQTRIKALINENETELYQPKDTLANKIYYRIFSYYQCRAWNLFLFLFIGLGISFTPDITLAFTNHFAKADAKKEIRFLKKLIIINGSIKPVDFMELLKLLIDKSKYHKKMLIDIEEKNKKNSVNKRSIYRLLIKNAKDIDTKLFYEKLDQANNYDFDQAVLNIENEFKMEKRSDLRKVRKQIEIIHAAGIIGFMVLIVILIFYLIIPWIQAYNMNQII
jgi:hypothetical protein